MLPNRFNLPIETENQLKRLKQTTGLTPNILARLAFFHSIEGESRYSLDKELLTNGSLVLEKSIWLGKLETFVELLLKENYPSFDSKELAKAWAFHVSEGSKKFKGRKNHLEPIFKSYL